MNISIPATGHGLGSIFPLLAMLLISLVAMPAHPAWANTPAGFDCTFSAGTVRTYEGGAFKTQDAAVFTFKIGEINLQSQNASLITPKGKGDLKIVRAIGANHFLEVVTEGFLNITTIYDAAVGTAIYPAVHSRHFGLFGTPVVSQYQGTCKPR